MMKGYLAQKDKVNVSWKKVANALKNVAANYHSRQQADIARQTSTILYRSDYFGYKSKRETGNVRLNGTPAILRTWQH